MGPQGASTVTVTNAPVARRTLNVRCSADAGRAKATKATATRATAIAALRSLLLILGHFLLPKARSSTEAVVSCGKLTDLAARA
jgi:hypothetical protein